MTQAHVNQFKHLLPTLRMTIKVQKKKVDNEIKKCGKCEP